MFFREMDEDTMRSFLKKNQSLTSDERAFFFWTKEGKPCRLIRYVEDFDTVEYRVFENLGLLSDAIEGAPADLAAPMANDEIAYIDDRSRIEISVSNIRKLIHEVEIFLVAWRFNDDTPPRIREALGFLMSKKDVLEKSLRIINEKLERNEK